MSNRMTEFDLYIMLGKSYKPLDSFEQFDEDDLP
jgi:hypothetical protein